MRAGPVFDPYTQLMRQTLLAWQIAQHRHLDIDHWLHVHVIPAGNTAMRRPRTARDLAGAMARRARRAGSIPGD